MKIVVNHLTRMHKGHVCVAGMDLNEWRHVRPVVKYEPLKTDLLAVHGGPFAIGALLDLGDVQPAPEKPHTEDHVLDLARIKSYGIVSDEVFWNLLSEMARTRMSDIFGPKLKPLGQMHVGTDAGEGTVSLGCLRPAFRPQLYIKETVVRARLNDGALKADVAVTDIRLYGDDHATPDAAKVREVNQRLLRTKAAILSLGLSREYPRYPTKDQDPKHWLQLNNIHFQETPIWRLELTRC